MHKKLHWWLVTNVLIKYVRRTCPNRLLTASTHSNRFSFEPCIPYCTQPNRMPSLRWCLGLFVAIFICANYGASWLRNAHRGQIRTHTRNRKKNKWRTVPQFTWRLRMDVKHELHANDVFINSFVDSSSLRILFFFNRKNSMWRWKMELCRYIVCAVDAMSKYCLTLNCICPCARAHPHFP